MVVGADVEVFEYRSHCFPKSDVRGSFADEQTLHLRVRQSAVVYRNFVDGSGKQCCAFDTDPDVQHARYGVDGFEAGGAKSTIDVYASDAVRKRADECAFFFGRAASGQSSLWREPDREQFEGWADNRHLNLWLVDTHTG